MREPLPNRRQCMTVPFEHNGVKYYATAGFYPDWRLGEIFLEGAKVGSMLQAQAHAAAIGASLALQHGCAPETLRDAMPRLEDGKAPADSLGACLDKLVGEAKT